MSDHRPFKWLALNTGGRGPRERHDPGHVLEGSMELCTVDQIHNTIMWEPPTRQQCVILALEEMRGRDRSEIYRLFAEVIREP